MASSHLLLSLGLSLPLFSPSLPPGLQDSLWKAVRWGPCWPGGVGAGDGKTPGWVWMGPREGAGSGGQGPGTGVCTLPVIPSLGTGGP